jgi:hypothetical protein
LQESLLNKIVIKCKASTGDNKLSFLTKACRSVGILHKAGQFLPPGKAEKSALQMVGSGVRVAVI